MAAPFIISRRLTRAVAALPLPLASHRALRSAVSDAEAQAEPEQVAEYHERQAGVMNVVGGLSLAVALLLTNALHDVLGEGVALAAVDAALVSLAGAAWGLGLAAHRASDALVASQPLPTRAAWRLLLLCLLAGAALSLILTGVFRR